MFVRVYWGGGGNAFILAVCYSLVGKILKHRYILGSDVDF